MLINKDNYLAISDILLTVSMLATDFNDALIEDAGKIIDFISKSHGLKENEIEKLKTLVCDDLTIISTRRDANAYQIENGGKDYPAISDLLYLKMQTIVRLDNLKGINEMHLDYSYLRPYYPEMRFKELEQSSTIGNVDINRTTAMMLALGLGTPKDVEAAIYRFKQCAYWGDVTSLYYLSSLYQELNDEKNAALYCNLAKLSPYILEGRTLLPKNEEKKYEKDVVQSFVIISTIKQDIVLASESRRDNIDYSFLEVIFMDNLDYYAKIECINEYNSLKWKEITNSSYDPDKKLGFKLKGGK